MTIVRVRQLLHPLVGFDHTLSCGCLWWDWREYGRGTYVYCSTHERLVASKPEQ